MSQEEKFQPKGLYYTVIDGTLRTTVEKDHPEAVMREYETKDGVKSVKYERKVKALTGNITSIYFKDGDFGRTINIVLDVNDDGLSPVIQFSAESNYGEDFMKKLPSLDLTNRVRISPFAFTNEENGKEIRGVHIMQDDEVIKNYFYDFEQKTAINDFPTPDGDVSEYSKDDWKIFFLKARKFLIEYTQTNIIPKVEALKNEKQIEDVGGYPQGSEDVAF